MNFKQGDVTIENKRDDNILTDSIAQCFYATFIIPASLGLLAVKGDVALLVWCENTSEIDHLAAFEHYGWHFACLLDISLVE